MCGIAGILRVHPPGVGVADLPPPGEAIPERWLDILDESIKHRGPDGQGRFRDRARRADGCVVDVALVHRRLAIIDPACGHQPMVSERGKDGEGLVAVVFNGCIYNHRELRQELQAAGREFVTDHSDTEVLIHGWREWGVALTDRLEGMYALAIWDRDKGDLWMARDIAGEKPLWLYMEPERVGRSDRFRHAGVMFSSAAAACIRVHADKWGASFVSSEDWYGDWIRYGTSGRRPSAAQPFDYRATIVSSEDYYRAGCSSWAPPHLRALPSMGERHQPITADQVDEMLRRSVSARLEADVPIGCFLSGGVDSALVARFAREVAGSLKTFSVRMPAVRYDESEAAEASARVIGSEHRTLDCSDSPAEDLQHLITQMGVPFGDSSLLPTYWVSKAAREHVTVALSGDGGDELFCGYERYVAARWLQRRAKLIDWMPEQLLPDRDPRGFSSKLRRLVGAAKFGYWELLAIFPIQDLRKLMPDADFGWYVLKRFDHGDPAADDFWDYLRDDLMQKVDAASMCVGLEVRAPFLSRELIDACLRAPYESLMPRGQRKGLLRQVARKYLPADIVDRPKQGFAIPIGEWFRTDYGGMKQLLMDHLNSTEPWGPPSLGIELNMKFVRQMLDEHMSKKRDHSQRLYMLLVLSIWAKWLGSLSRRI